MTWDELLGRPFEREPARTALARAEAAAAAQTVYPPRAQWFAALERTAPADVRVVILGQDPYPQPGAATGRSFEVGTLSSWTQPFRQSSLRNILRAVYAAYEGELLAWSAVREKIARGEFRILPPDRLWDDLEAQGVLFLNAYLTVAPGKPGAHRALWEPFSHRLVRFIDENAPSCAWFLWGSDARAFSPEIKNGTRYESRHPMLTGPWDDDFLKNPCFRETASCIDWRGREI